MWALTANLSAEHAWVNHYAIQSLEHWEKKKKRGRTGSQSQRLGKPPASYDTTHDAVAWEVLIQRVSLVKEAALQNCLAQTLLL